MFSFELSHPLLETFWFPFRILLLLPPESISSALQMMLVLGHQKGQALFHSTHLDCLGSKDLIFYFGIQKTHLTMSYIGIKNHVLDLSVLTSVTPSDSSFLSQATVIRPVSRHASDLKIWVLLGLSLIQAFPLRMSLYILFCFAFCFSGITGKNTDITRCLGQEITSLW